MSDGILNVYKPAGMTSHDVVGKIRRIYGQKKVGHGGTLDPDAAGVLPVFLGTATRLLEYAVEGTKAYRAEGCLGSRTTTGDKSGVVVEKRPVPPLTRDDMEQVLARFRGPILQTPPMYSALKVNGRKLYQYARQGMEIERQLLRNEVTIVNKQPLVHHHQREQDDQQGQKSQPEHQGILFTVLLVPEDGKRFIHTKSPLTPETFAHPAHIVEMQTDSDRTRHIHMVGQHAVFGDADNAVSRLSAVTGGADAAGVEDIEPVLIPGIPAMGMPIEQDIGIPMLRVPSHPLGAEAHMVAVAVRCKELMPEGKRIFELKAHFRDKQSAVAVPLDAKELLPDPGLSLEEKIDIPFPVAQKDKQVCLLLQLHDPPERPIVPMRIRLHNDPHPQQPPIHVQGLLYIIAQEEGKNNSV